MLGGSFWIAALRNTISIGLMMGFFLMLDRPKFSMKKTIYCYIGSGGALIAALCGILGCRPFLWWEYSAGQ